MKECLRSVALVFATIVVWTALQETEWMVLQQAAVPMNGHETTKATAPTTTTRLALPPIHVNSSWVGNIWIPPQGYRYYSPSEMSQLWSNESFLFFGDSIARRTMTTLYAILNATTENDSVSDLTHSRVVDINRQGRGYVEDCPQRGLSICRPNPAAANSNFSTVIDWGGDVPGDTGLTRHITDYFGNATTWVRQSLHKYTIVVLSTGAWDIMSNNEMKGIEQTIHDAIDTLIQVIPQRDNLTIVYRTWGTRGHPSNIAVVERVNALIRNRIQQHEESYLEESSGQHLSSITYLDWGAVMLPRSTGKSRIAGDVKAHYDYQARVVFLQMLMNHLVTRRQRQQDWQQRQR